MRRLGLMTIILSLFLAVPVLAYNVEVEPINNSIPLDGTAKYEITVTNLDTSTQDFTISTADFRWKILSDPLSDYFSGFSILGGDSYTVELSFSPRGDLFYGIYSVRLRLTSEAGETKLIDVPVEIKSPRKGRVDYAPTVVVDGVVNGDDLIDPRKTNVLVLELDNRNPLNISQMKAVIESPFINEQFTTSLGPLEEKRIEFNFIVDELEEPRIDEITVKLLYNNQTIAGTPKSFPVQVISYSQILRDVTEEGGFLKTEKTVFLKNQGNVENRDTLKVKTGFIKQLFTVESPDAKVIEENGKKFLYWDLELQPGATAEIHISVNYRPILYVALLLTAGIVLYYFLRSPVVARKTAAGINIYEGGISEMKVLMHIKNRTPHTYNTFSVTEHIPKIAKYMKSDTLGSIAPSKVLNHERKGTLLKWNFEAIEPFEERIIIYKMKLNFTVLGKLNLPATVVKFKDENGGSYTTRSNKLRIRNTGKQES